MEDLRIKRTHLLLKNALFELLSQKSFDEIKVNDICNLAMVHRTTFYSHFQDKYDLLEYCIQDIKQEATKRITETKYSNSKEFCTNLVMNLLEYIEENKKMYQNILNKNSDSRANTVFMNTCIEYITSALEADQIYKKYNRIDINIMAQFYSGAVVATIIWWLKSPNPLTKKELCNSIISLIFDKPYK